MSILEEIKTHGYWEVVVRPTTFDCERIPFAGLDPLIRGQAIQIRGWDFPHIDTHQDFRREVDSISQVFSWEDYREAWRLWRSGQFIYLGAFNVDWEGSRSRWYVQPNHAPGELLGVGETAVRYLEFLRFARGMALAIPGDDRIFVRITANGLAGRRLIMDSPRRLSLHYERRATLSEFPKEAIMPRAELAAKADDMAVDWTLDLFSRFGWTPPREVVVSFLQEFGWKTS
jgi:hypothetical protein